MSSAISAENYIVIQPTFETIPPKYEPNLAHQSQRSGLTDIFGQASAAWKQSHAKEYTEFRVGNLERLITVARTFKEEQGKNLETEKLMVSQHRCLIPWRSFYPDTSMDRGSTRLHINDLFLALNRSAGKQGYRNIVPSLAPMLRIGLTAIDRYGDKVLKPEHLSTNSVRQIPMNGTMITVRDMIVVRDEDLKERLLNAPSFSIVATPYLQRWSLTEGIESAKEVAAIRAGGGEPDRDDFRPACIFWHIASDKQVSFEM